MNRRFLLASLAVLPLAAAVPTFAAQIGVNTPFPELSVERINTLPVAQRQAWLDYLNRSKAAIAADQAALKAEREGMTTIPDGPKGGNGEATMPLDKPAEWYGSAEAKAVADNIVSFQTPAGGWGKNQPHNGPVRLKGQHYVANNMPPNQKPDDFDAPHLPGWGYVGTIDNDATITETRFLLKVFAATKVEAYRASALRGLQYLLNAQFPNGGWPQVWPLTGGYHDGMTLNDNAMSSVMQLMGDAGRGEGDFAAVPAELRTKTAAAETRAIQVLLDAQVIIDGKRTLWAQQYDPLTLTPTSARNYEPPALSSSESASVLTYLMKLNAPSKAIVAAVHAGAAMLEKLKIEGMVFSKTPDGQDRLLTPKDGAGPLWSRYYDMKTLKPIFGNRSKTLHDTINDVEPERRRGYSWFNNSAASALSKYAKWKETHA
ncbi:pectate lyase [Asticcacaulis sp. YBE204]|uniref:pectate lyase n=1 Tax=Asticcacaulis sp. YBE204 TaxID=1282363 RepID=UPI0003C3F909|nr:pectate lyase [Asticcacaulis sp. YBE204]ESQ78311.1 hypothetical protein AEYBE204_14160 [Asticcacaulis sp. YBE204]